MRPGMVLGMAALAGLVVTAAGAALLDDKAMQAPAASAPVAVQPSSPRTVIGSVLEGRLVSVSSSGLTVEDVFGAMQRVEVDASTGVTRGADYVSVTDHNASRLRPGDALSIYGVALGGGVFRAGRITANGFIGRDGLVAQSGSGFIDVRLRSGRLSTEYNETPERFVLDPGIQVQSPSGLTMRDAGPGVGAHIQGFIADDGTYVVMFLWLYRL